MAGPSAAGSSRRASRWHGRVIPARRAVPCVGARVRCSGVRRAQEEQVAQVDAAEDSGRLQPVPICGLCSQGCASCPPVPNPSVADGDQVLLGMPANTAYAGSALCRCACGKSCAGALAWLLPSRSIRRELLRVSTGTAGDAGSCCWVSTSTAGAVVLCSGGRRVPRVPELPSSCSLRA